MWTGIMHLPQFGGGARAVDHRRRGQDLGSKVGELLDVGGRGQQIAVLLGLVPEKDALGAGPQPRRKPAHFVRPHLRRGTRTGTVVGNH
jgi:hypothetical protein